VLLLAPPANTPALNTLWRGSNGRGDGHVDGDGLVGVAVAGHGQTGGDHVDVGGGAEVHGDGVHQLADLGVRGDRGGQLKGRAVTGGTGRGDDAVGGAPELTVHVTLQVGGEPLHFGVDGANERALVRLHGGDDRSGDLDAAVHVLDGDQFGTVALVSGRRQRAAFGAGANAGSPAEVHGEVRAATLDVLGVLLDLGQKSVLHVELLTHRRQVVLLEDLVGRGECKTSHI
jgi:hypothetical protein